MNKFKHHYYNAILKEADSKNGRMHTIHLDRLYLKELPSFIKDLTVNNFNVINNQLTSCNNFPKVLEYCWASTNKIKSLEGLQNIPQNSFHVTNNKITSLEYLESFPASDYSEIFLCNNYITSFKGLQNLDLTTIGCTNNQISSWEYLPKSILKINLWNNKLTGWKGMPKGLQNLYVGNNWDVQSFDDYEPVSGTLEIGSSKWSYEEEVLHHMRHRDIPTPQVFYLIY
jgi:hypothetical protein